MMFHRMCRTVGLQSVWVYALWLWLAYLILSLSDAVTLPRYIFIRRRFYLEIITLAITRYLCAENYGQPTPNGAITFLCVMCVKSHAFLSIPISERQQIETHTQTHERRTHEHATVMFTNIVVKVMSWWSTEARVYVCVTSIVALQTELFWIFYERTIMAGLLSVHWMPISVKGIVRTETVCDGPLHHIAVRLAAHAIEASAY